MAKFIELTDSKDQPLMVNVDSIIWIRPYSEDNGSMLYVTAQGQNNYPVSLYVKESYSQLTELMNN